MLAVVSDLDDTVIESSATDKLEQARLTLLRDAASRAPVDGVVNDVQVTTIGGFVQAGEKVMEVVPLGDKLLVETRIKPSDIAFIKVGDKAIPASRAVAGLGGSGGSTGWTGGGAGCGGWGGGCTGPLVTQADNRSSDARASPLE